MNDLRVLVAMVGVVAITLLLFICSLPSERSNRTSGVYGSLRSLVEAERTRRS